MFATLEFIDLCQISFIVMMWAGGSTVYNYFRPADKARLRRLEEKVDLLLKKAGIGYLEAIEAVPLSDEVEGLAQDPEKRGEAIELHLAQAKTSREEATKAVDAFIASLKKSERTAPPLSDEVKELAQAPDKTDAAIELHSQQANVSRVEAAQAVEAYIAIGKKEAARVIPVAAIKEEPVTPSRCPRCGTLRRSPNDKKCTECGHDLLLCPWCRKPLRSLNAKQCFECGKDWHFPPEPTGANPPG